MGHPPDASGAPGCSRPACPAPAAGRLLIDTRNRTVVVDAHTDEHGGAALLCVDHLARLRPARGWTVVDVRAERPPLFEDGEGGETGPSGPRRRRSRGSPDRTRRPRLSQAADQLAFEADAGYELPEGYDRVSRREAGRGEAGRGEDGHGPEREPGPESPSAADSPLVRPDARHTPLLARAFEAALRRGEQ
jgi:hypothetical protein